MKKRILLAMLLVAATAMPAFAAVQNVTVGLDIESTYLYRRNFDLGFHTTPLDEDQSREYQSLFITQSILRIDADLTEKVAATLALINERIWNNSPSSKDSGDDESDVDVWLAFIKIEQVLGSVVDLIVGRQDFRYGNSFIFDSAGTNNVAGADSGLDRIAHDLTKQTALDAIRAILRYDPLTIDLVFAVIDSGERTAVRVNNGQHYLYGTNVNYQVGDEMDTEIETYFWYKTDKSPKSTEGSTADVVKVLGLRFSTNPTERLNIQGEGAWQGGTASTSSYNKRRRAFGAQAIVNYRVPLMEEYNPVVQYVFTKVTGDNDDDSDEDVTSDWHPFFESQGGGTIYNTLFNLTNAIIHTGSVSVTPMEDVMAKISLTAIFLEDEHRDRVSSPGIPLRQPDDGGTAEILLSGKEGKTHLGKEVDFELTYDYTEDVQFGLLLGYFFPGSVFKVDGADNDNTAKQVLVNVGVAF